MRTGPIDFDTRATRCDPLYVLPVGLVAVELGWRWGLGAAALAFALYVAWSLLADVDLSALGYATRALVLFALGGVLGQLAARARATGEESERWFSMATDLLATSSLEGCFTHLNPARERTLGWTSAELMSRPYICALGCGCGTRSRTSAASGSNASRRSSTLQRELLLLVRGLQPRLLTLPGVGTPPPPS